MGIRIDIMILLVLIAIYTLITIRFIKNQPSGDEENHPFYSLLIGLIILLSFMIQNTTIRIIACMIYLILAAILSFVDYKKCAANKKLKKMCVFIFFMIFAIALIYFTIKYL